jgi:hypothetical protein
MRIRRMCGQYLHHRRLTVTPLYASTPTRTSYLLTPPPKTLFNRRLWEIDTEGPDVESVQKGGKALAEPRQALVHELQVHEVGFEVGHAVCEFGELGFQGVEGARAERGR